MVFQRSALHFNRNRLRLLFVARKGKVASLISRVVVLGPIEMRLGHDMDLFSRLGHPTCRRGHLDLDLFSHLGLLLDLLLGLLVARKGYMASRMVVVLGPTEMLLGHDMDLFSRLGLSTCRLDLFSNVLEVCMCWLRTLSTRTTCIHLKRVKILLLLKRVPPSTLEF